MKDPRDYTKDISEQNEEMAAFWRDEARAAEDDEGWDYYRETNLP